ncbi:MAG: M20/M25/M40 family metallo-hydrolase [Burkholderiaceae bacterium]|nr:M20/M25/M40 family metallo-hydrolase [Burkholderiaceae bacterium]
MRRTLIAAALALACGPLLAAESAWITVGDDAWRLIAAEAADARLLSSREVAVDVPAVRGSAALVRAVDRVHAVEIDADWLPRLSVRVHEALRRCGGFVRHDSPAEALAELHRLQGRVEAALAPSYAIDDAAEVNASLPLTQDSRILATIQRLSDFQNRLYDSSHGVAASDWLAGEWRGIVAGRSWMKVSQVRHFGWPQKSVKLVIQGSGPNAAETVVLGAHLDSTAGSGSSEVRAPGADDDASGVAALTEVVRVFAERNYRPQRTIELIAYAAEEAGLRGSQQIAKRYQRAGKPVVGVLQLDMTAFQGDATDLWIFTDYTNAAQNQFVADLAAAYLPLLGVGYDRCGYGCSDHASWTGRGFAASFPFEASFAHSNHAIHTANDTTATFGNQALHALKFTQLALAYAVELGSD